MKTTRIPVVVAMASLLGLTACTTYVDRRPPPPVVYSAPVYSEPPPPVYTAPASVEVVIRDERDFYEPLSPYGHWEYVGNYGRCWVPARVESNWRPYSNGHWERTDAGWYWVSDEPWGWATYHYGRWDYDSRAGWYWIPQTTWAPAWVTWHRGGGYVGWSPLPPSARVAPSGVIEVSTGAIPQRGYVFVEERRFLEPIRPATVVNNTTIINKTVNITNVKVVNNTVINEGPRVQEIEQAGGRKIRTVPARELRDKIEAPVAASRGTRGNERDAERTTPAAPVTGSVASGTSRAELDAERKAAERERQKKTESDLRAQEQQRKAQAEAERARKAETERIAKIDAERQAQAERARIEAERRTAAAEHKAQLEADKRARDQARQAQAETARAKQEADLRARELASREAQQKQAQKNQTETALQKKDLQKGNRKGQNKKATEPQPGQSATNAPITHTNAPTPPPQ